MMDHGQSSKIPHLDLVSSDTSNYHKERPHQGLSNRLIWPDPSHCKNTGTIQQRQRLSGLLNYDYRAAA